MKPVTLRVAARDDMPTIWRMQVEAFSGLLEKYQDHDLSPAAEGFAYHRASRRIRTHDAYGAERRNESARLALPVEHERSGTDHYRRLFAAVLPELEQHRKYLERLAEAHLVGKNTAEPGVNPSSAPVSFQQTPFL